MKQTLFLFFFILCTATKIISQTQLNVTNSQNDTVVVYVTFAAQNSNNKCCPTPAGLKDFSFLKPVPGNALQGTFKLAPKATQKFDAKSKCLSGNISFYIPPQCPVSGADFHHGKDGTSIAEFTLNPKNGCDEAFDISCVNGVNSFIQMKVDRKDWSYGPNKKPITSIYNQTIKRNAGLPGVYPVNCTDCIRLVGNAPCPQLPIGPAQKDRICNVQRSGRGGTLQIILHSAPPSDASAEN